MIKIVVAFALNLCIALALYGDTVKNRFLLCLAKEEEFIHKEKIHGPLYPLNQFFINSFSARQNFKLKDSYYKQICTSYPSSLILMSLLLTKGTDIFTFKDNIQRTQLEDQIKDSTLRFFFRYISYLEAKAPKANCLKNHIPYLKEILLRYNHLEDLGHKQVLENDRAKIQSILQSLQNTNLVYQKCIQKK